MSRVLPALCLLLCLAIAGSAQDSDETAEQRAQRLTRLQEAAETEAKDVAAALADFVSSRDFKDEAGGKDLRDKLARRLVDAAAGNRNPADAGIALHDDGYIDLARALLVAARKGMVADEKHRVEVVEDGRRRVVPTRPYVDVVTRLGWKQYVRPEWLDLAELLEVTGVKDYQLVYAAIPADQQEVGYCSPGVIRRLEHAEKSPRESFEALKREGDGAINARKAWIRFKNAQKAGKVDRRKGKRSFSPRAMGREQESVEDIWTYSSGGPFTVFIEKPYDAELNRERVAEAMALLRDLHAWFRENMTEAFDLRRVKPQDYAEQADREMWGFEVVMFTSTLSFARYMQDTLTEFVPATSCVYSPLEGRLIATLPTDDEDTQAFRESVLAHEAFHYLSDQYAANPSFTEEEMQIRPRYSSILMQEGLTDFVAGLKKEGRGAEAKFEFGALNALRAKEFKTIYEVLNNNVLFRLRDLLECRHFGQCRQRAAERVKELKLRVNPMWVNNGSLSTYYASACQAVYFFENFKKDDKFAYRVKWRAFVADEYQGKHKLKDWEDKVGIDAFKKALDIEDDADWDAIEAEFLEFTLALKPPDED